jgi:hypothetical protein
MNTSLIERQQGRQHALSMFTSINTTTVETFKISGAQFIVQNLEQSLPEWPAGYALGITDVINSVKELLK